MSERPESAPASYDFSRELQQFVTTDPSMRLNKITDLAPGKRIAARANPTTWVSKVDRTDDQKEVRSMSVGTSKNPHEIAETFNWGTSNVNDEILVKTAHEIAHTYQVDNKLEQGLVNFLTGVNNGYTEQQEACIRLYALLSGTARLSGLSTLPIYEKQSQETGLLSVEILEDITEYLGAYLISDEYFTWRLEHARIQLSEEDKNELTTFIIRMCPVF